MDAYIERDISPVNEWISMNIFYYFYRFSKKFDFRLKRTTLYVLVEQHLRKRRKYRKERYLWQKKELKFYLSESRVDRLHFHTMRARIELCDAVYK